mmetsp:Transcript_13813/g.55513  ORF Transcript_13813/g.55513 Transcript_13813/m.55513 type:complete len:186 (-) Transcript_13813:6766-7323(-)
MPTKEGDSPFLVLQRKRPQFVAVVGHHDDTTNCGEKKEGYRTRTSPISSTEPNIQPLIATYAEPLSTSLARRCPSPAAQESINTFGAGSGYMPEALCFVFELWAGPGQRLLELANINWGNALIQKFFDSVSVRPVLAAEGSRFGRISGCKGALTTSFAERGSREYLLHKFSSSNRHPTCQKRTTR